MEGQNERKIVADKWLLRFVWAHVPRMWREQGRPFPHHANTSPLWQYSPHKGKLQKSKKPFWNPCFYQFTSLFGIYWLFLTLLSSFAENGNTASVRGHGVRDLQKRAHKIHRCNLIAWKNVCRSIFTIFVNFAHLLTSLVWAQKTDWSESTSCGDIVTHSTKVFQNLHQKTANAACSGPAVLAASTDQQWMWYAWAVGMSSF